MAVLPVTVFSERVEVTGVAVLPVAVSSWSV